MDRSRRTSSEYSVSSIDRSITDKDEIQVTEEEKKQASSALYSILFDGWFPFLALIPAMAFGCVPIMFYLVFGRVITILAQLSLPQISYTALNSEVNYLIIIAVAAAVSAFFKKFMWVQIGSKLSSSIKKNLFSSMMKSDVTFFDVNSIGAVLTLLSEDAQLVQDSFGSVKGDQIGYLSQFLTGIIFALIYKWQLGLIILAVMPIVMLLTSFFIPSIIKNSEAKFVHVSSSMTIAEETLSSIRTVKSFNREDAEKKRFDTENYEAYKKDKSIGYAITTMMSIVMAVFWGSIIVVLLYGASFVEDGKLPIGDLFSVFGFGVFGFMGILQLQGSMQAEQKAVAAGARILKLTNHIPDMPFEGGSTIENFQGRIEFQNVSFKYPTRDVYVLRNASFVIEPGTMAALVGHSGSGKSTIVQLLERFYDPTEGVILIDNVDIKELDPRWIHRKMALVSQEPVLFRASIRDNIAYGVKDATEEMIYQAAEAASAKKFIDKMENKFDTMVGEKGSTLSGGQRQRVAIARAIIKDPTVLITDEATSALDAESEKKVQTALDAVMRGRTSVVVAHRLSTIRHASIIYVFEDGQIKEQGTHDELLQMNGVYYNLVQRQLSSQEESAEQSHQPVVDEDENSSHSDSSSN